MGTEPNRHGHNRRRSWKVRAASGFVAIVNTVWFAVNSTITAANLPSDASQAWTTIVSAPQYIPAAIVLASLGILVWSLWPSREAAPAAPVADEEGIYQEELARRRAVSRAEEQADREAENRKFVRSLGLGNFGEVFAEKERVDRAYEEELARHRAPIQAKAQLMHDRLASRGHSYGRGRAGGNASEDSYLAALWEAEQKDEIYDDYHRSTFPPPPPNRWELLSKATKLMGVFEMPLRDVVRRVAFDSKWAIRWDRTNALALTGQPSAPKWQLDLKAEVLRQLCTLRSRGTYQEAGDKPHNGVDPIPLDFWQEADFDVVDMLVSDLSGITFIPNKYAYRDVKFDTEDIDRMWPKRGKRALKERPSPFLEWVEPWRDQADFRAAFNERAWDIGVEKEGDTKEEKPANTKERLRALIAQGRDVVHRWRTSDRSQPFEIFASKDRDYLDVQPYLGDEYQARRSRRGRTAVFGANDIEDYYAGQLLRELARLERESEL